MTTMFSVALIGNPNCGKTTIINALTGSSLRVGNWPGVTVERKSGFFEFDAERLEVIDLPGTYSLTAIGDARSLDENIACEFITTGRVDVLVNVLDAANLERNLYLTTQLLEMHVPMVVVVNMVDVARAKCLTIDMKMLEKALGCPVIALESNKAKGIVALKKAIVTACRYGRHSTAQVVFPEAVEAVIAALQAPMRAAFPANSQQDRAFSLRVLEGDSNLSKALPSALLVQVNAYRAELDAALEDLDLVLADGRYSYVHQLSQQVVSKPDRRIDTKTMWLDKIILNRFLGIPIFLIAMYLMFLISINVGGAFQDFFDISTDALFVQGLGQGLLALGLPDWLVAIIASGAGKGVNTTITFIPVIGMMFLCLSFLEASGYMVRAAFVMDRLMQALGLPGKAFVPMIVGFGCNVPAIMAARTLESQRDRILTVMMAPFMSCSARLAIFAVFTSAFFPSGGQNIVFALYLIGIFMAVMTGWLLRKTLLQGKSTPFIMEMPPYHLPTLKVLSAQTWARLKGFIFKAGKLIVPICMLIGTLNAVTVHGISSEDADSHSLLSMVGQTLTPVFTPMGIHSDNWPATVGLLTGTLAKEVVVATLNTLYSQAGNLPQASQSQFDLWGQLKSAWQTIPANLQDLSSAFANPIEASVPEHSVDAGVYGQMVERFQGKAAAFAYLLFILLYVPCASTIAVMAKELNKGWAWFSVLWSVGLAYGTAVLFYQGVTYAEHPLQSLVWLVAIGVVFAITIWQMRQSIARQTTVSIP